MFCIPAAFHCTGHPNLDTNTLSSLNHLCVCCALNFTKSLVRELISAEPRAAAPTGLITPIWRTERFGPRLLQASGGGRLAGGRTEGRGQQGRQSPNTCTWSPDSAPNSQDQEPGDGCCHPGLNFLVVLLERVEQGISRELLSASGEKCG